MIEHNLKQLLQTARTLKDQHLSESGIVPGEDEEVFLQQVLKGLASIIEKKTQETHTLLAITQRINSGFVLEEVLDYTYESLNPVIPYNRIGFSLLEDNGQILKAFWARSDSREMKITKGYSASMQGSSLKTILETGKPRIINDLVVYLKDHPNSESTRLVVEEGFRSSLTCPLVAMGKPMGFIFFTHRTPSIYKNAHVETFQEIAGQLALIVEKSRLYQRLLELDKLKNKFLGIAAHDLRSPISVIKGNLDLINDGLLGEVLPLQKEAVEKMRQYCKKMLSLINDLLDISAIESGQLALRLQEMELIPYFENVYVFNSLLAKAKRITLKMEIEPHLPRIAFDPERIDQVINNLVANAIKFSHPQTTVTLTVRLQGNDVKISVTDQGQGIPAQEIPKLFNFFSKVSVRPTADETSTGLGLAICRRLVMEHGGEMGVESQVGRGSTFFFTLPRQR